MSADADELLARAVRAEERDEPTREDVLREFEETLDEIESKFPSGKPKRGARPPVDGLRYQTLMMRIKNCKWRLEDGNYVESPRPALSLVPSAEGDEHWQAFVESHPELTDVACASTEVLAPLEFTDEELLAGLRTAIERREQPWLAGAASSSCVLVALAPGQYTKAASVRIGRQFARLSRGGSVVRLRRKWTKGRGDSIWSLPGMDVNGWWLKQYELEAEDA